MTRTLGELLEKTEETTKNRQFRDTEKHLDEIEGNIHQSELQKSTLQNGVLWEKREE
jgi:hypothetical protein